MSGPLPLSYQNWKHCITQLCSIELTPEYIEARIATLGDHTGYEAQRFIQTWGEAHLERVRQWFAQAREELRAGGAA